MKINRRRAKKKRLRGLALWLKRRRLRAVRLFVLDDRAVLYVDDEKEDPDGSGSDEDAGSGSVV